MAKALFWIASVSNNPLMPPRWSGFGSVAQGDPSSVNGGTPFAQPITPSNPLGVPGADLYLTAQGSGDGGVALTLTPPFTLYPLYLPRGYRAWGLGGLMDSSKAVGSATVGGGGTSVTFPTVPGLCQSMAAQKAGKYYFEYTYTGLDLFSNRIGIGVGRLGVDLNYWINSGRFSLTDPNGGARVSNAFISSFPTTIAANGGPDGPTVFNGVNGVTVGVAVLITDPDAVFHASGFEPVSLVCTPCAPLVLGPGWPGRFG